MSISKNIKQHIPGECEFMSVYFRKLQNHGLPPIIRLSHLAGHEDDIDYISPKNEWGKIITVKLITKTNNQYFMSPDGNKFYHGSQFSQLRDNEIKVLLRDAKISNILS